MQSILSKDKCPHFISLLACCTLGWITYECYRRKHELFSSSKSTKTQIVLPVKAPIRTNLDTLPLDMLLEVMSYLGGDELLMLRQVSTLLNQATCQLTLWRNIVKDSPSRYMLKKRFDVCSSQELEDAFREWRNVDERWANPGQPRRVEQVDGLEYVAEYSCRILPGGRWLIQAHASYGFSYFDLNAPAHGWRTLIPAYFDPGRSCVHPDIRDVTDIDPTAQELCFNTVVMLVTQCDEPDSRFFVEIDVWRCTPTFDEDGLEVGLQAIKVSSFEERNLEVDIYKVTISGNFIAVLDRYPWHYRGRPIVIDWTLVNGYKKDLPCYRFKEAYPNLKEFYILPKSKRLVCISFRTWNVLSWSNHPMTSADVNIDEIHELPSAEVASLVNQRPTREWSGAFHLHSDHAYFTVFANGNYERISIPVGPGAPSSIEVPTIPSLAPNLAEGRGIFGENRALLASTTEIVTCAYNGQLDEPINRYSWGRILPPISLILTLMFDDVSGRCLLMDDAWRCFLVDL